MMSGAEESQRKWIQINTGKVFEKQFKNSMDRRKYFNFRIPDPAQSFGKTEGLRFSRSNPFDYFCYSPPLLFTFELKSTKSTSITFWRDDFEDIKKNRLL